MNPRGGPITSGRSLHFEWIGALRRGDGATLLAAVLADARNGGDLKGRARGDLGSPLQPERSMVRAAAHAKSRPLPSPRHRPLIYVPGNNRGVRRRMPQLMNLPARKALSDAD